MDTYTSSRRKGPSAKPVLVAVLAGQDGRAARPADRVGDERIPKDRALVRDAVQVRRRVEVAVRADGPQRVIVGHDVQDVGFVRSRRYHNKDKPERGTKQIAIHQDSPVNVSRQPTS